MKGVKGLIGVTITFVIIAGTVSVFLHRRASNRSQTLALGAGDIEQVGGGTNPGGIEAGTSKTGVTRDTSKMFIGKFPGTVVYDAEQGYYFLELRGARLPFKTSPREALEVRLEARGKNIQEKNRSLLYGMLGPEVLHTTLLINPDEEDEVMPAVEDLARYIRITNPRKFAGFAYTKPGGDLKRSVVKGSQIQSFHKDASPTTPLVLIKGPKSGARSTRVRVLDGGKFVVEGETYADVTKAADFIGMTLVKMLCGSPDCPDAASCATGGDCGCG
ncbi:MAG: hypothetical protein ACE5JA_09515 [bacterium]